MSQKQNPVPIVALPPTKKGPEYISTTTSIGFMGRLCLTTGVNYLLGIGFGGILGAYKGLRNSPSPRFRIRLNSFLNGAAQAGSHSGNALAVFTMYYLSSYHVIQRINFKYHILGDKSLAFCAGMTTGFLYKLTAVTLRANVMATFVGGFIALGFQYVKPIFKYIYIHPFIKSIIA